VNIQCEKLRFDFQAKNKDYLIAWTVTLGAVEMSNQVAPKGDQLLVAFLAKRTLVPLFI